MTIPSRPAPAPPGSRAQTAAAGANASLEQLRLQLQQQQMQQQQNGSGMQKLTIKLPPPPKGPINGIQRNSPHNLNNNNNSDDLFGVGSGTSSITRKFPQARYTPATNWDDTPFGGVALNAANGNFKKVPPPRPPPPKVQVSGGIAQRKMPIVPPIQSANILTNIFNRKKASKTATAHNNASRVYGVSSGNYGSVNTANSSPAMGSTTSTSTSHHFTTNSFGLTNGSSNSWHTTSYATSSALSSLHNAPAQEAQLISFDSPPSSPTFTQKSNSDCVSVDSFSSDSNFSSPNNGSVSQPESGFEDDFSASARSRPATTSPLDPWETLDAFGSDTTATYNSTATIGTAPVRNLNTINSRILANNDNPLCNGKSLLPPAPSLNMPTIIKPKISQKPKAPKPPMFKQNTSSAYGFNANAATTPPSPPMPQGPPPPLPGTGAGISMLDVINGKVDPIHLSAGTNFCIEETVQPYGVTLYDFEGVEEGDLSFRENEKIYLLEQVSDEWYRGRTRAGCEGIFPCNYIDIKVPLATTPSPYASETTTPTGANGFTMQSNAYATATTTITTHIPRIRCLYNFPAEVAGDLALKENELVTILYRINEDWLHGEIDGRQGQFPANFLEYVPDNIPMP